MQRLSAAALILLTLLLLFGRPVAAKTAQIVGPPFTQEDGEPAPIEWSLPENLSFSGSAIDPQIVTDSSGRFHVLWRDVVDGIAYTTGEPGNWRRPVIVEGPFSTRSYFPDLEEDDPTPLFDPVLAAGPDGRIHAVWIGEEGGLFYSNVSPGSFTNFSAWSPRQALDDAALAAALTHDDQGRIHLATIRQVESPGRPAGIYYRRLNRGSNDWTAPIQLYASRYLRALEPEQANINVLAQDANRLYVTWDDSGRDQVYVARSGNGGSSWEDALQIDGREPSEGAGASGPANILAGANDQHVLLSWTAGHGQC